MAILNNLVVTGKTSVGDLYGNNGVFSGYLKVYKPDTADTMSTVQNINGEVCLLVQSNRGLYDVTGGHWMLYKQKSDNTLRTPMLFHADAGIKLGAATVTYDTSKNAIKISFQ